MNKKKKKKLVCVFFADFNVYYFFCRSVSLFFFCCCFYCVIYLKLTNRNAWSSHRINCDQRAKNAQQFLCFACLRCGKSHKRNEIGFSSRHSHTRQKNSNLSENFCIVPNSKKNFQERKKNLSQRKDERTLARSLKTQNP